MGKQLNRVIGAAMLVAAAWNPAAAAPDARARGEIEHLLGYVARPACQFNRNGAWYDGAKARAHLQQKYDYLVKHDMVTDAESFIAKGASSSSFSGRPYLVKCGTAKAVPSAAYLTEELQRYRRSGAK